MGIRKLAAALAMALGLMAGPGAGGAGAAEPALDVLDAHVSYIASFYVTTGDKGTYRGQVWHMPGRERRDYQTSGGGQILMIRRDLDAAYLMKPSGRWYVGLGLRAVGALAGGLDAMQVERRKVREETVAGVRATRWAVHASSPKGRFDGDIWTSREGIVVKLAGTVVAGTDEPSAVEMGLSGLKVVDVDPITFELPKGWFGMDLRSVPAEKIEQAVESLRPMLESRKN